MDLNALLRLVFLEKNDITFGVLTGLLLVVLIWLLVRSVIEEKANSVASASGAAIDAKTINTVIEGALKKALGENAGAAGAVASGGDISADAIELKKTLNEREAKISALMSDLEAVKGQMDKSTGAAGADEAAALQAKVKELQSKLAEYEIIEDDIADLSIYKEENKKLKDELDRLRAAVETAQTQVHAAQVATDPAPLIDAVQAAQAAVVNVTDEEIADIPQAPPTPMRPAPAAFKLDADDDVMGEFAQALAVDKKPKESSLISGEGDELADPKAALEALFATPEAPKAVEVEEPGDSFGELDTEKMLAEVASMKEAAGAGDSSSVLDEQLDTDRLMAEMGMGEPAAEPQALVDLQSEAAPAVAASKQVEEPEIVENEIPVDDLLAEFKDTDFLKGTKGS